MVAIPDPRIADRADAGAHVGLALELRKITKRFGAITANKDVDFGVAPGEIRGLVGENGAGKSTLMAIASGLYRPDAGQVLVAGQVRDFDGRDEAIALGINMVHQHFMLVPSCTVAQNVVLGQQTVSRWLRLRELERQVADLADRYGLRIDPRAKVEDLTPTERQRVEILAALWRGRSVLILDEPTSVLGPGDVEQLFSTMRRVANEGCAVVFTSHKLREVIEICDRISVMRHGEMRTTVATSEADVHVLATLMVGKQLAEQLEAASLVGETEESTAPAPAPTSPHRRPGETVLALRSRGAAPAGEAALGELTVAAGEIVGVAGVEGNGQTELAEILAGLQRPAHCQVQLDDRDISDLGPGDRARLGVSYVPEDPTSTAIVPSFPVSLNLGLRRFRESETSRRWSVDVSALRARAARAIQSFDIRGASADTRTSILSGGNQQKVVLARELEGNPRLLIIVDPTVGLDVGAATAVHTVLRAHRDQGVAIVLISTDLDEIEALGDRIVVLYRGAIIGVVQGGQPDRRAIGLMMTGLSEADDPRSQHRA